MKKQAHVTRFPLNSSGFAIQAAVTLGLWALLALPSSGAVEYRDYAALSAKLKEIAGQQSNLVQLTSLASSHANRQVWLVEVGAGKDDQRKKRPALLVVGGIEGDAVSDLSIVRWIEQLVEGYSTDDAVRTLLDQTTIYAVPRANPDAAESYFSRPRVERTTNRTPGDDDHDGLVDEDGPEDLNGDGLISWIRVEHPEGEYIVDQTDPRILIKADKAKGERGIWKLLVEGIDNDQDEEWNEDGTGGVNFNRNFPYGYKFFAPWAGPHPVSEVETRALADFVVDNPNIGVVFTFGNADNLLKAPKSEPGGKRPPTAISDADAPYLKELGRAYRESLGLKKELDGADQPGSFSDWIYFHRGRFSLATRPWSPAQQIATDKGSSVSTNKDAAKPGPAETGDNKITAENPPSKKEDKSNAPPGKDDPASIPDKKSTPEDPAKEDRAALKWFDEHAPDRFIPWTALDHPDFPGRKVEIGGWAPQARTHPPEKILQDITAAQANFLTTLATKLPRVAVRKVQAKSIGNRVFDVTLQVENTSYLPTALDQGSRTLEVLQTRVVLKVDKSRILAGKATTLVGPIAGSGGMEEVRYTLLGTNSVEFEIISALGGSVQGTIELKEEQ